jgi:hypothetical protein
MILVRVQHLREVAGTHHAGYRAGLGIEDCRLQALGQGIVISFMPFVPRQAI